MGQGAALGDTDVEQRVEAVHHHQSRQQERNRHGRHSPPVRAGLIEPNRGGDTVEHARREHRIRASEQVQKRDEQQAARRGAGEVEEVGSIDAIDRFGDGARHHGAREKEGHCACHIDRGERKVACSRRP